MNYLLFVGGMKRSLPQSGPHDSSHIQLLPDGLRRAHGTRQDGAEHKIVIRAATGSVPSRWCRAGGGPSDVPRSDRGWRARFGAQQRHARQERPGCLSVSLATTSPTDDRPCGIDGFDNGTRYLHDEGYAPLARSRHI
jgi:hypothetical protein